VQESLYSQVSLVLFLQQLLATNKQTTITIIIKEKKEKKNMLVVESFHISYKHIHK
jgi:hypothetical protein